MPNPFCPAQRQQGRIRIALTGVAGAGKTLTALYLARGLGGKVALIDTEHGRASKYAHRVPFDTLHLDSFHPNKYIEAIHAAGQAGYAVTIIDSLSHAWTGKDGALELKTQAEKKSTNSFTAWAEVTPLQTRLIEAICHAPTHIICTMRSKTKYELVQNDQGKLVPKRLGMEAVQRDGIEYEFDLVGDLDLSHTLTISKSVLETIHPGDQIALPTDALGQQILADLAQETTSPDHRAVLQQQISDVFKALPPAERGPTAERYWRIGIKAMRQAPLATLEAGWAAWQAAQQHDPDDVDMEWRVIVKAALPTLEGAFKYECQTKVEDNDTPDAEGLRLLGQVLDIQAAREEARVR